MMLAQARIPYPLPPRSSPDPRSISLCLLSQSTVLSLHLSRRNYRELRLCNCTNSESGGVWEEPDDGSDSEYEEAVSEGDEEKDNGSSYEEDLLEEIRQLLTPEEMAILEKNKHPDLSKISTPKWHPLHSYALSIQIPLMDRMIENGVDINSTDKDGLTPLHKAVMGKKEAVISHLLRKNADPHVRDKDGATPLHYAVQVGAMQTVKLLIKYNVDVNVTDNEGWTPLHLAMQGRNREIGKVLVVHGADSTMKNKDGRTALDLSLCYGRDFKSYDLAKLLKIIPAKWNR